MGLLTVGNTNQFGSLEEYWRITVININMQYKYCDISIAAYVSQEARDLNAEPMNTRKIRAKWDEGEFDAFFSPTATTTDKNIYQIAYDYIKYKEELFNGAVDI